MRLIDADRLIDMLYDNEYTILCPLDEVSGVVDVCQTIDAVRITRCKDCKYFGVNNENDPYCANRRGLDDPEPDGFCNYGEPKEERENGRND